jgi:hypothetical protein
MDLNTLKARVVKDSKVCVADAFDFYKSNLIDNGIVLTNKIISEIISQFIGHQYLSYFADNVPDIAVLAGKSDNDTDVVFVSGDTEYKLEIKVTCSGAWRGGEFSTRHGVDHLMVQWAYKNDDFHIYASIANLHQDDWASAIDRGYYAPSCSKMTLAKKYDRVDIIGNISDFHTKNNRNFVTLSQESLSNIVGERQ